MASKPGERKTQILQTLAEMLEQPHASRITTAALAARLSVSEAALYRHFASKAQMFEGLIEFIETSIFTLVNQIAAAEPLGVTQARQTVAMLLTFSERNKGMTRVLTGDALVTEDNRLQERINHINDRIEASLRQSPAHRRDRRRPAARGQHQRPCQPADAPGAGSLAALCAKRLARRAHAAPGRTAAPGAGLSARETPFWLTLTAAERGLPRAQPLAGLAIFQGRRA